MALTRFLTVTKDVPHEPGEWFRFKMPSHVDVEEARERRRLNALKQIGGTVSTLGMETWEKLTQARSSAEEEKDPESTAVAAVRNPQDEYDGTALLNLGIAGWSYCEPYTEQDAPSPELVGQKNPARPVKVTAEEIAGLDSVTQKWAFLVLADLCEHGFHANREVEVRASDSGAIEVEYRTVDDPLASGSTSTGF